MSNTATLDWSAARVLITGAGGVLGAALAEAVRAKSPAALATPTHAACDLLDQRASFEMIEAFAPTVVFHLAGRVAGIQGNMSFTGQAYYENAQINLNVIEGARRAGASKIVAAGTTAVYSDHAPLPIREDEIGNGRPHSSEAPYGQAKLGMLAQLEAYRNQYGLSFAYLVCTNLYGPNDRFDERYGHVAPSLISRFHRVTTTAEPTITIWGDGTPMRDFLYSSDAADAFIRCAESGEGVLNTATGHSVPIRTLVETIRDVSGFKGELIWDVTKPKGQLARSYDISRLTALGWKPRVELREGIERTYRFFAENVETVRR